MKAKRFIYVLILAGILLAAATSLKAQNAWTSTAESIPLKKISGIPYEHYPRPLDWVILPDESSIVFINDFDDEEETCYLWAAHIDAGGNLIRYTLSGYHETAYFRDAFAFWFPGDDDSENGFGLLFYSVIIPRNVIDKSEVHFYVERFDATGKTDRNSEALLEIMLLHNQWPSDVWLGASQREGAIGVVMAYGIYEASDSFTGYWGSQAHFLEYNPGLGVSPAGVKKIKQKKDGKNWMLHPYKPVWNGASWMIPAVETKLKTERNLGSAYGVKWNHKLITLIATPLVSRGDINIKKRTLERDNTHYDIPYENLMFLPPNPVDLHEESLSDKTVVHEHMLLYTKAFTKRNLEDRALKAINHEHYLRIVNANGKNIEPRYELETPEWTRKYAPNPNWYVPENFDIFSNALFIENGLYFIAQSRSAYFLHQANPRRVKSELQLDFYHFDPFNRVFERIDKQNIKHISSSIAPLLHFYTGSPCMINAFAKLGAKPFSIDIFFSRY